VRRNAAIGVEGVIALSARISTLNVGWTLTEGEDSTLQQVRR
jgi:hypothetical protein